MFDSCYYFLLDADWCTKNLLVLQIFGFGSDLRLSGAKKQGMRM